MPNSNQNTASNSKSSELSGRLVPGSLWVKRSEWPLFMANTTNWRQPSFWPTGIRWAENQASCTEWQDTHIYTTCIASLTDPYVPAPQDSAILFRFLHFPVPFPLLLRPFFKSLTFHRWSIHKRENPRLLPLGTLEKLPCRWYKS